MKIKDGEGYASFFSIAGDYFLRGVLPLIFWRQFTPIRRTVFIIGTFGSGHCIAVDIFILSLGVIFAGFANHVMQISLSDFRATIRMEEKPIMVRPQYALILTSLVLCLWIPDSLYQTIIHAMNSIGGGF